MFYLQNGRHVTSARACFQLQGINSLLGVMVELPSLRWMAGGWQAAALKRTPPNLSLGKQISPRK